MYRYTTQLVRTLTYPRVTGRVGNPPGHDGHDKYVCDGISVTCPQFPLQGPAPVGEQFIVGQCQGAGNSNG